MSPLSPSFPSPFPCPLYTLRSTASIAIRKYSYYICYVYFNILYSIHSIKAPSHTLSSMKMHCALFENTLLGVCVPLSPCSALMMQKISHYAYGLWPKGSFSSMHHQHDIAPTHHERLFTRKVSLFLHVQLFFNKEYLHILGHPYLVLNKLHFFKCVVFIFCFDYEL